MADDGTPDIVTHGGPTGGAYRQRVECAPEAVMGFDFVPTSEWQEVLEGQQVPAGLKFNMDLTTGKRFAKLIQKDEVIVEDLAYIQAQLKAGCQVDALDKDASTLLQRATQKGELECVAALVEGGADVELATKRGFKPIHLAAKHGHLAILQHLVEKKASLSTTAKSGQTLLHLAAYTGGLPVLHYVLTLKKIKLNGLDANGQTALHLAAERGHQEVLEVLVDRKAKIGLLDSEGKSAADVAEDFENIPASHWLRNVLAERALDDLMGELGVKEAPKKAKKKKNKPPAAAKTDADAPAASKKGKKGGKKGKGGKGKKGGKKAPAPKQDDDEFVSSGSGSGLAVSDTPVRAGGGGMAVVENQPIRHIEVTKPKPRKPVESSSEEESEEESGDDDFCDDLD